MIYDGLCYKPMIFRSYIELPEGFFQVKIHPSPLS